MSSVVFGRPVLVGDRPQHQQGLHRLGQDQGGVLHSGLHDFYSLVSHRPGCGRQRDDGSRRENVTMDEQKFPGRALRGQPAPFAARGLPDAGLVGRGRGCRAGGLVAARAAATPAASTISAGWLTTVTARICLDMLRSRKSRGEEAIDEHPPAPASEESGGFELEQEALLADLGWPRHARGAAGTHASRARGLRAARHVRSFLDEIASVVGRTPEATRQLASRARRRVQGAPAISRPNSPVSAGSSTLPGGITRRRFRRVACAARSRRRGSRR